MKYTLLFFIGISAMLYSCSKDNDSKGPSDEDILNRKIEDIIPQKYLDTLKILGLEINTGVHPPNVEGDYSVRPNILDTSNIPGDLPGTLFSPSTVHLSEQSSKDFSIKLIAEHFIGVSDTSIVTAISGSGNDFTVYGKVKSVASGSSAIIAMIITATKEGDNLKNFKIGIINIDNSNGGTVFIKEGQGRLVYDQDFISEKISPEKVAPESFSTERFSGYPAGLVHP